MSYLSSGDKEKTIIVLNKAFLLHDESVSSELSRQSSSPSQTHALKTQRPLWQVNWVSGQGKYTQEASEGEIKV